ncbi:MAG: ABC transporter substrate-binding protein [Betaproteobacteria bacterium]
MKQLISSGIIFALLSGTAVGAEQESARSAKPADSQKELKVLRYAFEIAETTLDPQKVADVYSNIVNNAIFDAPMSYDYLARPAKLKANTIVALPEVSADFRTFTFRVKPGIYFADDEAFGGKKRELVAEDYVYTMKRLFDPSLTAPLLSEVEGFIVGSDEYVARARKANKLDYDAPLEGLKTLDRYTFQIKLINPKPAFIYQLADCRVACAVAREVAEKYGTDIGSHPVGTGPFRMTSWRRSSKMILEPNPNFRESYYDGEPAPGDVEAEQMLARFKGRRLPMIDRIEVSIIEEMQPRMVSFLGGGQDLLWRMPEEFANVAVPNNQLAPNLKKQGIQFAQVPLLDLTYLYFNMTNPVVGGYTQEKIALRRAITLAYKTQDEISVIRKNQAIPAQTPYSPGVAGYDPAFRTSANEYSPSKANALLDMYGYKRGVDGYRTLPDGSPLILKNNSTPTDRDKQIDEMWKRSMDDIGLRIEFRKARWPDLLKESYAGKLMMWQLGGSASAPDAETWLVSLYGPNAGQKGNQARFQLKEYDALFERAVQMPDTPERTKLYQEMARLIVAYAPWKINVHRIGTDLWYPYVVGFRRPLVQSQNWWKYVDIDLDVQKKYLAAK